MHEFRYLKKTWRVLWHGLMLKMLEVVLLPKWSSGRFKGFSAGDVRWKWSAAIPDSVKYGHDLEKNKRTTSWQDISIWPGFLKCKCMSMNFLSLTFEPLPNAGSWDCFIHVANCLAVGWWSWSLLECHLLHGIFSCQVYRDFLGTVVLQQTQWTFQPQKWSLLGRWELNVPPKNGDKITQGFRETIFLCIICRRTGGLASRETAKQRIGIFWQLFVLFNCFGSWDTIKHSMEQAHLSIPLLTCRICRSSSWKWKFECWRNSFFFWTAGCWWLTSTHPSQIDSTMLAILNNDLINTDVFPSKSVFRNTQSVSTSMIISYIYIYICICLWSCVSLQIFICKKQFKTPRKPSYLNKGWPGMAKLTPLHRVHGHKSR